MALYVFLLCLGDPSTLISSLEISLTIRDQRARCIVLVFGFCFCCFVVFGFYYCYFSGVSADTVSGSLGDP